MNKRFNEKGPPAVCLSDRQGRQGFTLIELLVVIAIIGLLASIIIVSLNTARAKARDARRISDMRSIITALELYYSDNDDVYPDSDFQGCGGWDTPGDGDFVGVLKTDGYISSDLQDPSTNGDCINYRYYRYPAGYANCDLNSGAFYVLGVVDMENSGNPHPESPGWSCPDRDWQGEMEWVTGNFEY